MEELSSAEEEAKDGGDDDARACLLLAGYPLRTHANRHNGEDSSPSVEATQPVWNLSYIHSRRASLSRAKRTGLLRSRHRHCAGDYERDQKRTVVS